MFSFVWKNVTFGNKVYEMYSVSHSGTVVDNNNGKVIPEFIDSHGNVCVNLYIDEVIIHLRLDYIVLSSHFREPIIGENVCIHINGKSNECRLMNLEWGVESLI